ncbi:MAG: GDP-mannose 4,6-dehydratase [Myxococcales bacterium]
MSTRPMRHAVVFGGAGFIGSNVANRLLREGQRVVLFDSLARPGVERNLKWLKDQHGDRLRVQIGDIRDATLVRRAVRGAGEVFHFAAQVAVTTSLIDPVRDFEVNGRGTLNVLEAIRTQDVRPSLVFTSTNKVYGGLEDVALDRADTRYQPADPSLRASGIGEGRRLHFESPYGCSKGCADQYVLDYARTFGIPAVVFRMSCIYGPRQFGTEDQGWVAHFLIRALQGLPITVYGDGKQVRDAPYVEDLVDAMLSAHGSIERTSGQAFNMGGGASRTISLLELLEIITELTGRAPEVRYGPWRTGDQRYYVSDTRKFQATTGWAPRTTIREGVARLHAWLREMASESKAANLSDTEATAG